MDWLSDLFEWAILVNDMSCNIIHVNLYFYKTMVKKLLKICCDAFSIPIKHAFIQLFKLLSINGVFTHVLMQVNGKHHFINHYIFHLLSIYVSVFADQRIMNQYKSKISYYKESHEYRMTPVQMFWFPGYYKRNSLGNQLVTINEFSCQIFCRWLYRSLYILNLHKARVMLDGRVNFSST